MSTALGRIMGKPSVKALRKRFSERVADNSGIASAYGGRVQIQTTYVSSATRLRSDEVAEFARDYFLLSIGLGSRAAAFRSSPPRPPDRPDLPGRASSAEELIAAIGLEP
jgi:hypothetical protein